MLHFSVTSLRCIEIDDIASELVKTLVKMCPVQRLYLSESALETTKMTPHLRDLQLQISNCDQDHVDSIAQNCPLLRSLTISSARFSDGRGVSFSKLESLQEMRLIDAALGKIAEFPRRLEKLSVTISSIDCEGTTSTPFYLPQSYSKLIILAFCLPIHQPGLCSSSMQFASSLI